MVGARGHVVDALQDRAVHILELVGNTPLLRLNHVGREYPRVEIYAKAEWLNPGGSVKDRPARKMIEVAEETGELTKDKIILDSTSGNTGIAYALIGRLKGYQVELVMPGNVSEERKKIVTAYGANIVYSSALEGSDGAQREAHRLNQEYPDKYYMPDQYNNTANLLAHYETTGPEILEQTEGCITHFVAGIGTGGTLMGTGRRLKEFNPEIQLIAVEPDQPLHGLEGLKHMGSSIVPGIYDRSFHDDLISVKTEDAYAMAQRLAHEEGLFIGHSSGAAMVAVLEVASRITEGVVVTVFPDGGDRYIST
ncbi:MAG: PLP-dependent cysteine synthase family protein, partial [Candidatus Methylomirabilia bacterium]